MRKSFSSLMKNQNNSLKHKCEADVSLVERTVRLEIEKAYADLKALLLQKGCRIVAEEEPAFISVRQGSLWGISPRTAKKVVSYRLVSVDSGTRITCSSSLAADWKNLTVIGSVLAVVVASLCVWISMDLDALVTTQEQGYWSWIAMVNGYIDVQTGQMFAGLTLVLAFFLAIIIIIEAVVAIYAYFRVNMFAEETLNEFGQG